MMNIKKLIVLFLVLATLGACQSKEEKIRKEINLGIKANYSILYDVAIEHFENVIEWDENNKEAYMNMGRSYIGKKEYRKAIEILDKAILIDPKYGEAYRSRAQAYFILGDRDAACRDYLEAEANGVKNLYNHTRHCKNRSL